jgi:hypothetical protein
MLPVQTNSSPNPSVALTCRPMDAIVASATTGPPGGPPGRLPDFDHQT